MGPKRSRTFVTATPETARSRIELILNDPAWIVVHEMLLRVARYDAMTKVWEKLHPHFKGREDEVVDRIVLAYVRAIQLPSEGKSYDKYMFQNYPWGPDIPVCSYRAKELASAMQSLESVSEATWATLWTGNQDISFRKMIELIGQVEQFYDELQSLLAGDAEAQLPPPPTKFFDKTAHMRYFSSIMSGFFKRHSGHPLDDAVEALIEVTFDLKDGVKEGFARAARRFSG
jgi:hypothetical protein